MDRASKAITLSMESLRALANWAADCAERSLEVYEAHPHGDARPRAAIAGSRAFAGGEKRSNRLRTLAWAAYAAAREIGDPASAAAAHAASMAAAIAYTHPLADVHQTKHIVGPAGYAALALELVDNGDSSAADDAVRWAIEHASPEVGAVLRQMPERTAGKSRLDAIFYALDVGIRSRTILNATE